MTSLKQNIKEIYDEWNEFTAKDVWFMLVTKHYKSYLYYNSRKFTWLVSLGNIHNLPTIQYVKECIREIKK